MNTIKSSAKHCAVFIVSGIGIIAGAALLFNLDILAAFAAKTAKALVPFAVGGTAAYVLNLPAGFFERLLTRLDGEHRHQKLIRVLSVLSVLVSAVLISALLLKIVIPGLAQSLDNLKSSLPVYIDSLREYASSLLTALGSEQVPSATPLITAQSILDLFDRYRAVLLPHLADAAFVPARLWQLVTEAVVSFAVTVYLLLGKSRISAKAKRLLYAIFPWRAANAVLSAAAEVNSVFSGFICGKLLDSLIVGIICFVGTSLLGIEYSPLISLIVGITNIIPFFGLFLGAAPSALLLIMVDFWDAVIFVIFVVVLQQIDGNIIDPHIQSESTGLPALWVLFAITVGGALFGIIGLLISVPAFAVIYKFTKRIVENLLKKKNMPHSTAAYKVVRGTNDKSYTETEESL